MTLAHSKVCSTGIVLNSAQTLSTVFSRTIDNRLVLIKSSQTFSRCLLLGNCYSHIFHNSVKHAHCELSINIEQVLLTIYSHFSRSAKRISELKQYYEFYEQDFKVQIFLNIVLAHTRI
jgi:hypothetical protein